MYEERFIRLKQIGLSFVMNLLTFAELMPIAARALRGNEHCDQLLLLTIQKLSGLTKMATMEKEDNGEMIVAR